MNNFCHVEYVLRTVLIMGTNSRKQYRLGPCHHIPYI